MEKFFKAEEILKRVNRWRNHEDEDDYSIEALIKDMEEEEIEDYEKINIIQAVGLLAYHGHFVRQKVTEELLKDDYYSVSDFCKENKIEADYGELIALSKYCTKVSLNNNYGIRERLNKNNKKVKMYHIDVLKKVFRIK